jgi:putative FmdB family regulatory protein
MLEPLDSGSERKVPIYTYTCTSCNAMIEKRQSFSDAPLTVCDACGGSLRKVIHPVGIVFKGSGWYVTDSRKSSTSSVGDSSESRAKSEGTSTSSTGESKSDSTPSTSEKSSTPAATSGASSSTSSGK